jgi:molybdopterin/thiamine biosynthesis adenylyltransferase
MEKYLRQRGLVNQHKLMSKQILVSGSANGVGELVVLLMQLGFADKAGSIGIIKPKEMPNSVFWKLMYNSPTSWEEWQYQMKISKKSIELLPANYLENEGKEVSFNNWDIHLTLESAKGKIGDVNGFVNGIKGLITGSNISTYYGDIHDFEPMNDHPIHSSMRTIVAATLVNEALKQLNLKTSVPVSDVWLTVTCRVESTDLEFVRAHVKGLEGILLDVTLSHDDLATIARYRYPLKNDIDKYDLIEVSTQNAIFEKEIDVGFIPWAGAIEDSNPLIIPQTANICVLGMGGLGSWATPLICEAIEDGEITIIDGDEEIDIHNLNRQVIFSDSNIGSAKSEVAKQRLSSLFPQLSIKPHMTFFNRYHLEKSSPDGIDINEIFDNIVGTNLMLQESINSETNQDEEIRKALVSSDVYLGCLDNMQARTLLNEAALINDIPMINGGSESIHGIVERLYDEGCMVCRYGKEAANLSEVISCTEEGVRPISSIVTTTAWVGSMMAAITILELAGSPIHKKKRFSWSDGEISSSKVGKPPWFDEECIHHI